MQIFAIIVLIVVIIAVTHVHNWVTRVIFKGSHDGIMIAFLFLTAVYVIIMFYAFKYLILWAYPLIN